MDNPGKSEINTENPPRVLVAPLDWGLGHATRCIPVIRELQAAGAEVWLAGEGAQQKLLQAEFPHAPFLPLPGYRIRYSQSGAMLPFKMLAQLPRIFSRIRDEHAWLLENVVKHDFQGIVSDSRFGLHHPSVPSVLITHQLAIQAPALAALIRTRNYGYINQFSACWVPDWPTAPSLAGLLSHPRKKPKTPLHYIGALSRFSPVSFTAPAPHLLVLLSGPEPQRTLFENLVVDELAHHPGTATVVRGLPDQHRIIPSTGMLQFHNHLGANELEEEIKKATLVICRSGYSTLMDMATLGKKMVLVPTPGQTEQVYLAGYWQQQQWAPAVAQRSFSLRAALRAAQEFSYSLPALPGNAALKKTVADFVQSLG